MASSTSSPSPPPCPILVQSCHSCTAVAEALSSETNPSGSQGQHSAESPLHGWSSCPTAVPHHVVALVRRPGCGFLGVLQASSARTFSPAPPDGCLEWLRCTTPGLSDDSLPAIVILLGEGTTSAVAAAITALLCRALELAAILLTLGPAVQRGSWHIYLQQMTGRSQLGCVAEWLPPPGVHTRPPV